MELLTRQGGATLEELSHSLGITARSVYRYIEFYRETGFGILREGQRYMLDPKSPFFRKVAGGAYFSEDEVDTLLHVIEQTDRHDSQTDLLHSKLMRQSKWRVMSRYVSNRTYADNVRFLYKAVADHRMVKLHQYKSLRSGTVSDRIVEPYAFLGDKDSVRCYEPSSQENKTFRVSRIGVVELLPVHWNDAARHDTLFTDSFHFSGDRYHEVRVRLDFLAVQLLLEEYPACEVDLRPLDETHWLLHTRVCSFKGIGRFCLSLPRNVQVLGEDDFVEYFHDEVKYLTQNNTD
ncbi:MAG: WYL domain-containing protein [Bacteroidaceae bacterium]|nr:WYL domain-containing protein [Bacteroidaceae bacterium]